MRKVVHKCFGKCFGLWAAVALSIAAGSAHATTFGMSGTLQIQITTLPPAIVPGTADVTVNGSGGGAHLQSLDLVGGTFATTGFLIPVTDPQASPIGGVQVTAMNGAGSFAVGTSGLEGPMPIVGTAKVCLFGACSSAVQNLTVPLSPIGIGGSAFVNASVRITVVGAPWTTGTAAVGTITQMGEAHGPVSATSTTAADQGHVRLVTPIFISTNIPASAVVPAFGFVDLDLVPEPMGALLLKGAGIAGLVLLGRSRRRP